LAEGQLIAVANQLRVLTAKRNQVLLKAGSTEKTSLYIIEGSISLEARDGQTRVITVDENDELRPVAQLRPCIYDVTALGPVSYMKVDVEKLTEIAEKSESGSGDISVHSMFSDFDEEDNSIVNHLYHNLMNNSITLPSLPSVAERIQRVYRGRETDIDAVVHILISYPDVARKIKNVARCAGNDNMSAVEKIRYSLSKLGLRAVYCIIMTYAVGKLVKRMPPEHLQRVDSFWHHSLNVAALSRILAKKTHKFSPDVAMLAGLIHGIGVLAIDDRLLEHRHLMLDHLEPAAAQMAFCRRVYPGGGRVRRLVARPRRAGRFMRPGAGGQLLRHDAGGRRPLPAQGHGYPGDRKTRRNARGQHRRDQGSGRGHQEHQKALRLILK
jgi:CRP-like cAMP-binding protein